MAFWNRRKRVVNEAGDYFKATEAVSRPTAFALSLVAFFVVFAIVFGAILGGRWAWDKIANNDDEATQQVAQNDSQQNGDQEQAPPATEPNPTDSNQNQNNGGTTILGSGESTTTPNSPSTSTPSGDTSVSPNTTNSANSNNNLPNTGPASNLAIFLSVTIIATIVHRKFSTRN